MVPTMCTFSARHGVWKIMCLLPLSWLPAMHTMVISSHASCMFTMALANICCTLAEGWVVS